jgi:hypothetical protein
MTGEKREENRPVEWRKRRRGKVKRGENKVGRERGRGPPPERLTALISSARSVSYLLHSSRKWSRVSSAPQAQKRRSSSLLRTRFDAPKSEWSSRRRLRRVAWRRGREWMCLVRAVEGGRESRRKRPRPFDEIRQVASHSPESSSRLACLSALTLLGGSLPPPTSPPSPTGPSRSSEARESSSLLLAQLPLVSSFSPPSHSLHSLSCDSTLACDILNTLPARPCTCPRSCRSSPPSPAPSFPSAPSFCGGQVEEGSGGA